LHLVDDNLLHVQEHSDLYDRSQSVTRKRDIQY